MGRRMLVGDAEDTLDGWLVDRSAGVWGFFILCCVVFVRHGHLSGRGAEMLAGSGWVVWIVVRQMRLGAGELTGAIPIAEDCWLKGRKMLGDHSMMTMVEVQDDPTGEACKGQERKRWWRTREVTYEDYSGGEGEGPVSGTVG
jgi:hypothetical protein